MENIIETIKKEITISRNGNIVENGIVTDKTYLELDIYWSYINKNPGHELQLGNYNNWKDWITFKEVQTVQGSNKQQVNGQECLHQMGYTTYTFVFSEYTGEEDRKAELHFLAGSHQFTEDAGGTTTIQDGDTEYIYTITQNAKDNYFNGTTTDVQYKYSVVKNNEDKSFENTDPVYIIDSVVITNVYLEEVYENTVLVTLACNNEGRLKVLKYNITEGLSVKKIDDFTNLKVAFEIEVPNNTSGTLQIIDPNRLIPNVLTVNVLKGSVSIGTTEQEDYWSNGPVYTLIDRNEGSDMDATALLFKQTQSNAYSTIEQKDNTLFLGNYTTLNPFQTIFNYLDNQQFQWEDSSKQIPLNITTSSYGYVPDLQQSSRDKRIFKKGENYLLGFVLVYNNGYRSPVYYYDKWEPGLEPFVQQITAPEDSDTKYSYFYNKPIYKITFPTSVVEYLSQQNIIGVLPVCAINTSYNILCQGFISPTMQNQMRTDNNEIVAQYSWYYRQIPQAGKSTFLPYRLGGQEKPLDPSEPLKYPNLEFQFLDIHTEGNATSKNDILDIDYKFSDPGKAALTEMNWQYNTQYMTINTPEVEFDEYLTEYMLKGCSIRDTYVYGGFNFINGASIEFRNGYPYSKFNASVFNSIRNRRAISEYAWYGFLNKRVEQQDQGWRPDNPDWVKNTEDDDEDVAYNIAILREKHYRNFMVYPWQRDIPGGEKADTMITSKVILNYLYNSGITKYEDYKVFNNPVTIDQINLYRDFDTVSLIKFPNAIEDSNNAGTKKDGYYQGNIDYAATTQKLAYAAYAKQEGNILNTTFPRYGYGLSGESDAGQYAGYNQFGEIKSPISLKYKSAPHLVIKFNSPVYRQSILSGDNKMDQTLHCVELYNEIDYHNTNAAGLSNYQWVQCGDLKRVVKGEPTTIVFEEGDYYFARYDSMRTRPFTEQDPNSVIEVVSGMLCSRVNLDARTDRNRGTSNPFINDRNFNRFNPVYNQANNYFNYVYTDYNNFIMNRKFSNTIQWSLTKIYGNEIDDWCRIHQSSTLDLDGDKGTLTALKRLKNSLFAFQDTGISQIMYNEQTQISTVQGVPIEIGNSNKVSGKVYVQHKIGCQQQRTITSSEDYLFFIDSINRSIYLMQENGQCLDIGYEYGMYSWEKHNIHDNWWSYYDYYLKEVLFTSANKCIGYNPQFQQFTSFLSYENTRWNFRAGYRTVSILHKDKFFDLPESIAVQMKRGNTQEDMNYNQELQATYNDKIQQYNATKTEYQKQIEQSVMNYTTCWLKNESKTSTFFSRYRPQRISLICQGNDSMADITFTNIYYKMDCYSKEGNYLHDKTFTQLAVQNEYQHTGVVPLSLYGTHEHNNPKRDNEGNIIKDTEGNIIYEQVKTTNCPSNLKKKFREWRIQVPRALYGKYKRTQIFGDIQGYIPTLPDPNVDTTNISGDGLIASRDRIRNHWCKVELTLDNPEVEQLIFHDITIQYYM